MRLEPDKERFIFKDAPASPYAIHAVDFSDERSCQHFVTVWTKGKMPGWDGRWPHHNRDVYHRDGPWIPATFPGKEKEGWSSHYHVNLGHPPNAADLEPFAEHIPPPLMQQINAWEASKSINGPDDHTTRNAGCLR